MRLGFMLVPALALASCSRPAATERKPTEAEMNAINDALVAAYVAEDVTTLRDMLSDRHIHNNVFGTRLTKDEFLSDIETGILQFESYETPEIEWFLDTDLAVATGTIHAKAIRDGNPVPADTFTFTRVFARENGAWKVLLFQNTMVRSQPGP
ncbi:DUF4440 domain-containing protein [Haloferula helveola]|uniref:DUF4440 domain-containing protein n=1 Tax=Haloferula helveola TaxID=490095 RepID=A0ABN6H7Y1_9BACT|nr:DUF4440 domain-containing protein [Haloferula helveola]